MGVIWEVAAMPRPAQITWLAFTTASGTTYDMDLSYAAYTAHGCKYDARKRPIPRVTPRSAASMYNAKPLHPALNPQRSINGIDQIIEHCQVRYFADRNRSDEQRMANAPSDGVVVPIAHANQMAFIGRDALEMFHVNSRAAKSALLPHKLKHKRKQVVTAAAAEAARKSAPEESATAAAATPTARTGPATVEEMD